MIPIIEGYLAQISPGMRILDVGCGTHRAIQSYCQTVGAEYEGIDIEATYFGKPVIATRMENLADLSFPNEFFRYEAWGIPSAPVPRLVCFPRYLPQLSKPAFVLDIQATKDKPVPSGVTRGFRATGRLAALRNYPVSYNIHRVLRKAAERLA